MIDHLDARRLGVGAMDFPLGATDLDALDGHLAGCASCRAELADLERDGARLRTMDLGPVAIDVRAHVAIAAERHRRAPRVQWMLAAAATLALLLGLGGVVAGIGGRTGDTAPSAPLGQPVHWQSPVVDLSAADVYLEAGGRRWVPPPDAQVSSDPADAGSWTLEIAWMEDQVAQRINLYFAAQGDTWWIDEVRIYDGRPQADWLERHEIIAHTPMGMTFEGDLDLAMADLSGVDQGPGRLVMRGVELGVRPPAGRAPRALPKPVVVVPLIPAPGMTVACGPMDAATCQRLLKKALATAGGTNPGRLVMSFEVDSASGSFTMVFDDGSALSHDGG